MFWQLTLAEVEAVLERVSELERAKNLRAGLVAATVINVNRRKGAKLVRPQDFFRQPRSAADYMSTAEARRTLDAWAASHNAKMRAPGEEAVNDDCT